MRISKAVAIAMSGVSLTACKAEKSGATSSSSAVAQAASASPAHAKDCEADEYKSEKLRFCIKLPHDAKFAQSDDNPVGSSVDFLFASADTLRVEYNKSETLADDVDSWARFNNKNGMKELKRDKTVGGEEAVVDEGPFVRTSVIVAATLGSGVVKCNVAVEPGKNKDPLIEACRSIRAY